MAVDEEPGEPGEPGSVRLGEARLGSARARLGSARLGPARIQKNSPGHVPNQTLENWTWTL